MAPLELEGSSLGQKHKHFNKLVQEAVSKQEIELSLSDDDDIQNLLKIDVACKTRNVEFLLKVLKSEDLLYASRAIKNSKWLITDKEYSPIVNPEYFQTKLSPEMTTKAYNKLLLSVRLNLKDEDRVEGFYKYVAGTNIKASYKWLQYCSVSFIERELKTIGDNLPLHLLKRLVERHFSIFKTYMSSNFYTKYYLAKITVFLANYDTEKYLDALEAIGNERPGIMCNSKTTGLFMTRCPNRILDKFEFYAGSIHLPTFVKYLKEHEDIEKFLLKHARNEKMNWFFTYHYVEPFVKQMPKDTKFKFVKKIFIDKEKIEIEDNKRANTRGLRMPMSVSVWQGNCNRSNQNIYQWYKLAPFDIAFAELKKCIRIETTPVVRLSILQVLLSCAGRNMIHLRSVLKYFHQKHSNEPFKFKIQFMNTFISKQETHEFDEETWELLNQLYQGLEVYIESGNNVQSCIKSILVHHVIRGEQVPSIIKEKFVFDDMKQYRYRLKKPEQKDALFSYLYESIVAANEEQKLDNALDLERSIELCNSLLNLLFVWKKDLQNYPYVIQRITYLNKVKLENSWHAPIDSLYNVNKSWKKILFEESMSLSPTPETCMNALKHDSALLMRHKAKVEEILTNDGQVLRAKDLLSKIRIYWSNSLADEWKTLYRKCLEESRGQKAAVIGLFTLLNQNQLNDVAKKYSPSESKIDWQNINEHLFNIQKQIAKNLSKARPLCPLENVLLYAKGDYLQFAVPSINSILSRLSANKIRQFVPRLLDAPISLQKFGVRYAFKKLDSQELKLIFNQIWNSTKNSTIRTVLFIQTHALLCKEKNTVNTNDVWELFNSCLDNLSAEENKIVYKTLGKALGDGHVMRYKYYEKSYTFLKSLPVKADCNLIIRDMEYEAIEIMEFLDNDFVANVMFKDVNIKISTENFNNSSISSLIASYILSCKDEETAIQRYELFLAPLLDSCLPLWNQAHEEIYRAKINLIDILTKCLFCIETYSKKNFNIHLETFRKIFTKLEAALSYQNDYVFLTTWKLGLEFVKLLNAHRSVINEIISQNINNWHSEKVSESFAELHLKIAPEFAKHCVEVLKEDLDRFYTSVYFLFAEAVKMFFGKCSSHMTFQKTDEMEYLKSILLCSKDKEVYLAVYFVLADVLKYSYSKEEIIKKKDLCKILYSHPSEELKMHFHQLFTDEAIFESIY